MLPNINKAFFEYGFNSVFVKNEERPKWLLCHMVGFCTYGAPSVAGHKADRSTLIKKVIQSAVWTHCMIHRKQVASKALSPELGEALQQVLTIMNYIKTQPLHLCMFAKLCEEMGSDHDVLFRNEACYLERTSTGMIF